MAKRTLWIEDSSLVSRIDWWVDSNLMDVLFQKGDGVVYRYQDVDRADFGAICSADSVGSTFHSIVDGKPYERLL